MELLNVFFASVGSVAVLFILTKLVGNKQMSELSMFDYINGITIGSIAAEMATSLEDDFLKPLLAMAVYTGVTLLLAFVAQKSIRLRRMINGKSIFLYDKGKLFRANLKTAKLDVSELLMQCRVNGYFSLEDIETIVLEPNGKLSILPKAKKRPCTPSDLALGVPVDRVEPVVIQDGKILYKNLKYTGNDESWLLKNLNEKNVGVSEVFLAVCNNDNELIVYKKSDKKHNNDVFI